MRRLYFLIFLFSLLFPSFARASDVIEVVSPGGIKAWLIEDHKLPLVAMNFAFRGGVEQDPRDKQGLANLTMSLLTEGAGPYTAEAFQQALADRSIVLKFSAGRDALFGGVKCLSEDREKAFELLNLALTKPAFNSKEFERNLSRQLAGMRAQLGDPDWQGRFALFQFIFGEHPYGSRRLGSTETLANIRREDVQAFATQHMARDNLIVAVAGDIKAEELGPLLDKVFGALPAQAKLAKVTDVKFPDKPSILLVPREGTQTGLLFSMPGPKRDADDWYAAEIANYILGGGGFTSRLMQNLRDKAGLTYGISTGISPSDHAAIIVGQAATENAKAGQAWGIILTTMQEFYKKGVTEKEINAAKDYLTGSLPLTLTSTERIAAMLVNMQLERLGKDYLMRHSQLIKSVKPSDVARVIQRWFNPETLSLSMVGKPEGIKPTETKDQIRN